MSEVFETLYTALTALLDHIEYCVDLLNDGIAFIGTSWDMLTGMVLNLPAPIQGILLLFISLAVLCLIFNR